MVIITLTVRNPDKPSRATEREFLVDSRANATVVPPSVVEYLHLDGSERHALSLGQGRVVTRQIGEALIGLDGEEFAIPVVLGEGHDDAILGAATLASLGLTDEVFRRKPIRATPISTPH